uniref:Metalloendopeptidase n=1 Tax=Acrobeloides nanus TaxID=290746 RepID=A0A914CXD6_9BILA
MKKIPYSIFNLLQYFITIYGLTILPVPHHHARKVKNVYDSFSDHFLLPQDFDLAQKLPVKRPTPAELDAIQNNRLFEGDILGIPLDEELQYRQRLKDSPLDDSDEIFRKPYHSSLNLVTYPDKLWTDGRVPYMLEEGMTNAQRAAIAQALDEYKEKTCIRFVPRQDSDYDYIYIKRNVAFGCSSYVGRAGGNQTVSLEIGKCFTKGIIAHELMHSLGFFHEHSRTDRDDFVIIDEENIRPGMLRNFEKYPKKIIDPLDMPYDYESVMHYHKLAFSKNGKPTIVPRDSNAEIGQRYRLSKIDADKVNKLYKCKSPSPETTAPPEPGEETTTTPKQTKNKTTKTTTTTSTTKAPTSTTTRRPTSGRWITGDRWKIKFTTTTTKKPKFTLALKTTTVSTTTVETTTKKKKLEKCENLNAHCEMWEQLGHCQHSAKYMNHYCRKSCGLCSTEPNGEVIEKPKETKKQCVDKNLFCGYWARIGECRSESKFMKIFCRKSCGKCED